MIINLEKNKYVVLDVETNGLVSLEWDLLSISIYDPDTNESYDRFLPLELNDCVLTTHINGITEEDLKDKTPISQNEFDEIIKKFNLENRTILTYGSIDEKFIRTYCNRHKIKGFEKLNFFNFKHLIISSKFNGGNVTKDNLCNLFGIDNVKEVHSGKNDCILEWKLFEKIHDKFLLVTGCNVFELNDSYVIPISYLETYPNFKYYRDIPSIYIKHSVIKQFEIDKKKIHRYETNISGVSIEHLINSMLEVEKCNNIHYEIDNKNKLNFIGRLPSVVREIPISLNSDGTIRSLDKNFDKYIESVNKTTESIKEQIGPLIEYIKTNIFEKKKILSQELVLNEENNILSKCDLSTAKAVLEIKMGFNLDFEKIKKQLYFESRNRKVYVLSIDWKKAIFEISKVEFISEDEKNEIKYIERIKNSTKKFQKKIKNKDIKVVEYINTSSDIKLKCKKCGNEWTTSYRRFNNHPFCLICKPEVFTIVKKEKELKNTEKIDYGKKYSEKIFKKSNGMIVVLKYYGSKSNAEVGCLKCNHRWKIRADHLVSRCYCPNCRKNGK